MKPISLPIAELKPALIGLGKVINKHAALPVLAAVKIDRTSEGWITITGTDLDHFVTVRMEQPTEGEPISIVLPFDELLKTANHCTKEDIISLESGKTPPETSVTLRYPVGKQFAENRCASFPVQEFPATPRVKGEPVPVNDALRQTIHEAMECRSMDPTRYILNGIYLDVSDPKCNQVVATDGRHLFSSNSFSLPLKDSLIIPDHKFLGWKGFNSDGEWQIRINPDTKKDAKSLVQISSRRWRFITPQHEGKYPNYRQVIPTEFKTTVVLSEEVLDAVIEIVERIPCDLQNPNKPIALKIDGRKLNIRGRNKEDATWTEVEVHGAKVSGDNVTISLNRDFALKALKFGLNQIEIMDELSPLKFSRDGKQMIVMPVRPNTSTVTTRPAPPTTQEDPSPVPPHAEAEAKVATATTPERNTMVNNTQPEPEETRSALETAMEQMETLKENLKANLASISTIQTLLKTAQREQKVTQREYSHYGAL